MINYFKKLAGKSERENYVSILAIVLAILSGITFGFLIMLVVNPSDSIGGIFTILFGGFLNGREGIGNVLIYAAPILLSGLSVGFAFKTGLFNIGSSGQMAAGAFFAIYVGIKWTFLGPTTWIFAILAAIIGGAIWGVIPGVLKARFNVHEVVSTIMMNWLAVYGAFIVYPKTGMVGGTTQNAQKVSRNASLPSFGLDKIFGNNIDIGIIIAIIAAIIIYIILNKTTFGFELKAVGFNRDSAKYAGVNAKRSIIYSMAIAGALSGLAAAVLYLNNTGATYRIETYPIAEGFDGIAVALLALSNPVGIIFSSIFFAYLKVGGEELQSWGFDENLIGVIVASIVYFSALSLIFRKISSKLLRKKEGGNSND